ncbi:MAG TPA: hypothetical protein VK815_01875, partial [Candidatus Acidoferrales bacterium]|nr:hypothetical protein [Candidatus Acidoferrales bacterium]
MKPWFCALLLAVAWPAAAQQSVIFSKPGDLPTDKANDFMNSEHKGAGAVNGPSPMVSAKPRADFDILPGAQPLRMPSPAEILQWQKAMDEKKNWTLLTPYQILNIPTKEQIMGLPDPNHEENLSTEEKYIRRQERERNASATNAMRRPDGFSSADDNPFESKNDRQQRQNRPDETQSTVRLGPGSSPLAPIMDGGRNPDSIWHSAFRVIPEAPKPDPEQVAAMERFKAMMEPPAAVKPASLSGFSTPATPVVDHNLQPMPDYNPAGRTFVPVQNNAVRPTGLNPLPTVTGQRPLDAAPKPKPL